mmetsp:Transcript_26701/g.40839  ORF Transcript_26701/g.40839 Transcript_26701/m.40839 type:complete len:393 (-) Transcript_26701:705-1883(-)
MVEGIRLERSRSILIQIVQVGNVRIPLIICSHRNSLTQTCYDILQITIRINLHVGQCHIQTTQSLTQGFGCNLLGGAELLDHILSQCCSSLDVRSSLYKTYLGRQIIVQFRSIDKDRSHILRHECDTYHLIVSKDNRRFRKVPFGISNHKYIQKVRPCLIGILCIFRIPHLLLPMCHHSLQYEVICRTFVQFSTAECFQIQVSEVGSNFTLGIGKHLTEGCCEGFINDHKVFPQLTHFNSTLLIHLTLGTELKSSQHLAHSWSQQIPIGRDKVQRLIGGFVILRNGHLRLARFLIHNWNICHLAKCLYQLGHLDRIPIDSVLITDFGWNTWEHLCHAILWPQVRKLDCLACGDIHDILTLLNSFNSRCFVDDDFGDGGAAVVARVGIGHGSG